MNLAARLCVASLFALLLALLPPRDARACGGCFVPPSENTEVSSHRMALSISQTQSTLWDEIQYSGNPSSFAWVLPIKGAVTVGLSSDLLFAELDQLTAVTVIAPSPPPCNCPACDYGCLGDSETDTDTETDTETETGTSSGVTVIAQMVVGPYETVQLSSSDPAALTTWLTMHGYAIPTDIAPVIAAYVGEGFDFLALKLIPGVGVSAMKPVRVTTPGASLSLPLRMVAAGTGPTVPITLFVVAEGRYEPASFPSFTIDPSQVVWDFSVSDSNYATLRQQGFDASGGKAWLIESTSPASSEEITSDIAGTVQIDPTDSGYGDSMGNGALMAEQADLAALFQGVDPSSLWLTRMLAELPRSALSTDLALQASASQVPIPATLFATKYVNPPACDCSCPCSGSAGEQGGCAVAATNGTLSALVAFLVGLALMRVRRRGATHA